MSFNDPSPSDIYDLALKHAKLLRACMTHPTIQRSRNADGTMVINPASIHRTLQNVTDFALKTYLDYIIPLLPPNATKINRQLANAMAYEDPNFEEKPEEMRPECYPKIKGNKKLVEMWNEAVGRGAMIGLVITDRPKMVMFGGPFDFGQTITELADDLSGKKEKKEKKEKNKKET